MPYIGSDFSPADTAEIKDYSMDLAPALAAGETLSGSTWSIDVVGGVDASASSRLIGSANITGTITTQRIGGLVAGTEYKLTAAVTTSTGEVLSYWSHVKGTQPW